MSKTFPNSRFVTYRPELKRYGGQVGITIAEKVFEASSRAVLSFLIETKEITYERSLGFALQLNLSMLHAFGMNKKEAISFCNHLALHGDVQLFSNNLSKQKSHLLPPLAALWEALDQHRSLDKVWFNQWLQEITVSGKELKKAYMSGKLNPVDPEKKHKENPLWSFYDSYVHMNNNRLRIHNNDENYVAFILEKVLLYAK